MESFDITTGCDLQEVDNAVNQSLKEIGQRFDFKGVKAEIDYDRKQAKITVSTVGRINAAGEILASVYIGRSPRVVKLTPVNF